MLRQGILDERIISTTNLLDKGLDKMPFVPAHTEYYRGINLEGKELEKFIAQHKIGEEVTYPEYTFVANNRKDAFIDKRTKNVKITIFTKEKSGGRTIHDLTYGKAKLGTNDEAVFVRNSKFKVLEAELIGDNFILTLLEK